MAKKVVSFRLDEPAIQEVRRLAGQQRMPFTSYLEAAVLSGLDRSGKKPSAPLVLHVLRALRAHREELSQLGVRHASIFGSVARGEERPDSDVDIAVDIDVAKVRDLFAYSRVRRRLEELVGHPVDIARSDRLRPGVAEEFERDAINAF